MVHLGATPNSAPMLGFRSASPTRFVFNATFWPEAREESDRTTQSIMNFIDLIYNYYITVYIITITQKFNNSGRPDMPAEKNQMKK